MALDTEKQVDESIALLLRECAESDEEGLGGVLKVVTTLAKFMDLSNTMEVLNGLLYHRNEKIALNSLSTFRHLHEAGYINLQPIALSRVEDGEELVEPIDEDGNRSEDATVIPEFEEIQGDIGAVGIQKDIPSKSIPLEESIESLEIEYIEDIQEYIPEEDIQEYIPEEDISKEDISKECVLSPEMETEAEESTVEAIPENSEIENIALESDITLEEDISKECVLSPEMETGAEESTVEAIPENSEIENITLESDITLEEEAEEEKEEAEEEKEEAEEEKEESKESEEEKTAFEFQVPGISTFIPIEVTEGEENIEEEIKGIVEDDFGNIITEEIPEILVEDVQVGNVGKSPFDAVEELSPFGEIELESPFEDLEEPAQIGDTASPFNNLGDESTSPFSEVFNPEHEEKKIKMPSLSAIEDEARVQWEETVDKIAKLKAKYINK